ncbi:major facilitator superfamily protein [Trichomonas vaginalis G3]|uniref:Lysosomal dipeptide transporter MFSD1 n=1 Tax=Trichomonas vaginalis (strain ATCC PRA-98 / G3) TaxID=412133 RepID=A2G102_TRIV3|nr:major facilitator superfamily transporter [Trichomonas vaginalis G3]EAX89160.1 major facilitator superfamily protein [Trichomonas vaginalis G3]KAI5493688.1 Major Facilitator Superfamily [Trichomonas vaginalis G3]|eukprot:XP_001302090.1 major facilitator superfamily transporter [Trichomonas vaginalis G3]
MECDDESSLGKSPSGFKFQITRLYTYSTLVLLYTLVSFHKQCTSVLQKDIAKEYNVEENKITIFSSIYFYLYACSQPFAGLFADLLDPTIIVGVTGCIAAIGSIIIGASKSLAVGIFGRLLVGLGCGPTYVSTCRVITNWFKLEHLPIYMGILVALSGTGGILASLPLVKFANKYGWNAALYGIGGISGILSVFVLFFVRGNPISKGYQPVNDQLTSSSDEPSSFKDKMKLLWSNFKTVLSYKYFWVITLFNATSSGPYFDVAAYWGGPYLRDILGYDSDKYGTTMISLSIGVIAGSLILPNIPNLLRTKKWMLVAASTFAISAIIPLFVRGKSLTNAAIWVLYILIGFFTAPCISISYPLVCSYYHPKVAGSSVGLGNFFLFVAAAIYQQISTLGFRTKDAQNNIIRDWYGYKWGLWFFCIVSLVISLICALIAKETKVIEKDPADNEDLNGSTQDKKDSSSNEQNESNTEDSGSGVDA